MILIKMKGYVVPHEEKLGNIIIKQDDLIRPFLLLHNKEKAKRVLEKKGYAYSYSNETGDIQNDGDGTGWLACEVRIHIDFDVDELLESNEFD